MYWRTNLILVSMQHRRTGYFLPGGAVNRLPKKFFHVASNFYETAEQKRGPMQKHRPYWLMKMTRYSFSGSIPAKFKHKPRRHKQPFGKTATTVVLCIGQIEASTSPPPRHTLGFWHLCCPGEEGIWLSESSREWGIWSPCEGGGEFEP